MTISMTTNIATTALLATLCLSAGCGTQTVGVATPEALLAWSPRPNDGTAAITAVRSSGGRTYVGFSDGEMFFRANGATGWEAYGQGPPGGCGQPIPAGPVTSFAITEATVFTAYAGTPGAPGIWRSPEDRPCWARESISDDFLSLSVSPLSSVELLGFGEGARWVTHQLGGQWDEDGTLPSLGFDGDVRAMATGVGPAGAPRAWLGDAGGRLFYSDDLGTPMAPDAIHWHAVAPDPGFPQRPVVALSIAAERPQTIWITFLGASPDSLWRSDDGGVSWRNPHGGELPGASGADAGAGAPPGAFFVAVSPIPGTEAAVVALLIPEVGGRMTATSFWNTGGSDDWSRL